MNGEFSEFSYGYALTDNIRRSGLGAFTAAPILPSLIAEGDEGGGYDVALEIGGTPMLLQFKVPVVLTRHSALRPDGFDLPPGVRRRRAASIVTRRLGHCILRSDTVSARDLV